MRAASAWSSQNPGAPIASSSSPRRRVSRSGSKVITDPGELGPDLLQSLVERLAVDLGHAPSVAGRAVGPPRPARRHGRGAHPSCGRSGDVDDRLEVEPAGGCCCSSSQTTFLGTAPARKPWTASSAVARASRHGPRSRRPMRSRSSYWTGEHLVEELIPCGACTRGSLIVALARRPDTRAHGPLPAADGSSGDTGLRHDHAALAASWLESPNELRPRVQRPLPSLSSPAQSSPESSSGTPRDRPVVASSAARKQREANERSCTHCPQACESQTMRNTAKSPRAVGPQDGRTNAADYRSRPRPGHRPDDRLSSRSAPAQGRLGTCARPAGRRLGRRRTAATRRKQRGGPDRRLGVPPARRRGDRERHVARAPDRMVLHTRARDDPRRGSGDRAQSSSPSSPSASPSACSSGAAPLCLFSARPVERSRRWSSASAAARGSNARSTTACVSGTATTRRRSSSTTASRSSAASI